MAVSGAQGRKRRKMLGTYTEAERLKEFHRHDARIALKLEYVKDTKLAKGCVDCGYKAHPAALDFDHLPGTVKLGDVAYMARSRNLGLERLKQEIEKCEVVCANCHRIRTFQRGQYTQAKRK